MILPLVMNSTKAVRPATYLVLKFGIDMHTTFVNIQVFNDSIWTGLHLLLKDLLLSFTIIECNALPFRYTRGVLANALNRVAFDGSATTF